MCVFRFQVKFNTENMPQKPSKLLARCDDYREFIYRLQDIHHENKHDELISCALMGMYLWSWLPKFAMSVCCVVPDLNPQTSGSSGEDLYLCPLALFITILTVCQWHKEKRFGPFSA